MKLEEIGFYTLSDERAKNTSVTSDLQRCELILTDKCNFKCKYCRGMLKNDKGDVSKEDAFNIVAAWGMHNLVNIRFSGGEPTLWRHLPELVSHAKNSGVKNIALSTNGSANFETYFDLYERGINDFSISLDACCASTGDMMSGKKKVFRTISKNIERLSKLTYVTVGVVLTDENQAEMNKIINYAYDLRVSDIRIIPAAQISKNLNDVNVGERILKSNPILQYRYKNFLSGIRVRGLCDNDNKKCPIVLDDMAILNNKHYPCIIYMREHGEAIGNIEGKSILKIREERMKWNEAHNCHDDVICKNNCLDVCVEYNNRVKLLQEDK